MGDWIAGAIKHPGALHREMGVPQGQPIPAGRLQAAAGKPGLLGERARLAETLKGLPHRRFGGPMAPGQPTVVGEAGPEVAMAPKGGMVTPIHGRPGRPMGGGMHHAALLAKLKGAC